MRILASILLVLSLAAGAMSCLLIAGVFGVAAQEWDPSAYRSIPFSLILDKPQSAPPPARGGTRTPGFQEDLVKTEATYTGNRRAPQTDPRLMEAWVLARHLKPDAAEAFPAEYEFAEGKTVAWVRMFFWVSPDNGFNPVRPGTRMELYVHRIALGGLGPAAVALQARSLPAAP
jgi:hypothetical protein